MVLARQVRSAGVPNGGSAALSRTARLYIGVVAGAAALIAVLAAGAAAAARVTAFEWVVVVAVGLATGLLKASPVALSHRPDSESIEPEEVLTVPALVLLGPATVVLAAVLAAVTGQLIVQRVAPLRRMRARTREKKAFNAGTTVISWAVALAIHTAAVEAGGPLLLGAILGGVGAWATSHLLVRVVIRLVTGSPSTRAAREDVLVGAASVVVGGLIAALGVNEPWAALAVMVAIAVGMAVAARPMVQEALRRSVLGELLTATQEIHGALTPEDVEARLSAHTRTLLGAGHAAVVRHPPDRQVGASVQIQDDAWLVVGDRIGTYRRFDEQDLELLEALAVIARTSLDRTRLIAELRRSDDLRSLVLGAVSHDVRGALAAALAANNLLDERAELDAGTVEEVLTSQRHSLSRMQRIVEDLLTLGRLEHTSADGVSSVHAVVTALLPINVSRKEVSLVIEGEDARLKIDPRVLGRVLDNLVQNAVAHSPEGGTVRVVVEDDDGWVVVRVEDEGPGIAPEDRERIMEAFEQGREHSGGDRRDKGVGLGLYLARRFVRHAGGDITVGQTATGGGSFEVRLPRAEDE